MGYELTQDQAFDLVIRVGFIGDTEQRSIYLAHYTLPNTIDLRLTPLRVDPARSDHKFTPIITNISVGDALDVPGSVIF